MNNWRSISPKKIGLYVTRSLWAPRFISTYFGQYQASSAVLVTKTGSVTSCTLYHIHVHAWWCNWITVHWIGIILVGGKTVSIFWMCTGSPQHSPPVGSTAVEERVHEQVSVEGGWWWLETVKMSKQRWDNLWLTSFPICTSLLGRPGNEADHG